MTIAELSPLTPSYQTNSLTNCVHSIIQREPPQDSKCQKASRIGMYLVTGAFSAVSKVFYWPIAMKLASRIGGTGGVVVGALSAACNSKAFFTLEMWASRGIIKDVAGPKTSEEKALEREKIGKCAMVSTVVGAVVVAALTQIPYALPAADYNNSNYKYLAFGVSLIAGIFIPTRSIQLSVLGILKKISDAKKNADLSKLKNATVQLIKEKQAAFVRMGRESKNTLVQNFSNIRRLSGTSYEKLTQYFQNVFSNSASVVAEKCATARKYVNYAGTAFGVYLLGIFEYAITEYTFSLTKKMLWDNDIGAGVFAAVVSVSCLYLYGQAIIATSKRVFNSMFSLFSRSYSKSLGEQLKPGLNYALKAEETVTNFFALGPSFVIWSDFYDQPTWKHWLFVSSICTAIYFILITSSFDTVDDFTREKSRKGRFSEIVKTNDDFQKLANAFEKSPEPELAFTLKQMPEEIKTTLCKKASLEKEQFDRCIEDVLKDKEEVLIN